MQTAPLTSYLRIPCMLSAGVLCIALAQYCNTMISYPAIFLLIVLQCSLPSLSSSSCAWPDWTPECGQPACPGDCEKIRCIDELSQADCPDGSFLTEKKMFGCCPACVKYGAYGDICPGIHWDQNEAIPGNIAFGDDLSKDPASYPGTFIQQTIDLPCSFVDLTEIYSDTTRPMQERVTSVEWTQSKDASKMIPLITSPQCQPGLICQKIAYVVDVDGSGEGYKFTPGGPFVYFPSNDPYPICNAIPTKGSSDPEPPLNGFVDIMDCENKPCTCKALDYKLWAIKQYGEDCSQHFWDPKCDAAGLYSAVQFKVSTEEEGQYRWCSSPTGDLLYGKEAVTTKKSEMTCTCSQKRWELEQDKVMSNEFDVDARKDVSLHCTQEGSYETLQCDKGRCWCVEQKTGDAISIVVPESLIELLPCFDERDLEEHYGNQYLRKCENRAISIINTKELLSTHGTQWNLGTEYECDPDGSFAPVQCEGSQCRCYTRNGGSLGAYAVEMQNKGDMTCRCARDEAEELTSLVCQGNGDYATIQSLNGQEWCASPADGWRMSGKVPQNTGNQRCCLDSEYYYKYGTSNTVTGKNIGGYIFWNPDNRLSYACNKWEEPNENQPAPCRDCSEEIVKCQ